jgi:hypothetical protein
VCEGDAVNAADPGSLTGGFSKRIIPGKVTLTCGDLFGLPAPDGAETCEVLNERFSGHCGCSALAETVQDLLDGSLNLEVFKATLSLLNFDVLLMIPGTKFTVFAPPDQYLQNETFLQRYNDQYWAWTGHLSALLKHHIIVNTTLSSEDIWARKAGDYLVTLSGEVPVDEALELVGNRSILVPDLEAQNGVVHEINGLLYPPLMLINIVEVLQSTTEATGLQRSLQTLDSFSELVSLLELNDFANDAALQGFVTIGTTLIAPRNFAFQDAVVESTVDTLLYHVLEFNNYLELREKGAQVVLPTWHPTADVLLTVDQDGIVRYNDVEVSKEMLATNG